MFPENISNVKCIGFHRSLLPGIVRALKNKEVSWVPDSHNLFAGSRAARFEWKTAIFQIEEFYELVESVELISGSPVDGLR